MSDDHRGRNDDLRVRIEGDADIVTARHQGRTLASGVGFSATELALIATAISELARNIVLYAGRGEIRLSLIHNETKHGIQVVACDEGPGIPNIKKAMEGGHSTSGGLGLGLPGVKRLMDDTVVTSEVGKGTTVKTKKWKR